MLARDTPPYAGVGLPRLRGGSPPYAGVGLPRLRGGSPPARRGCPVSARVRGETWRSKTAREMPNKA